MPTISPSNKSKKLGFQGLSLEGEQSHWVFSILLYIACVIVFLCSLVGLYLSYGNYITAIVGGIVIATVLYLSSFIAELGRIKGNILFIVLGIIGLVVVSFSGSYFGNHYIYQSVVKNESPSNMVQTKLMDLNNSEQLIAFYQSRHRQLNDDANALSSNCNYAKLDSINKKCQNWKIEIENLKNQLINVTSFLTNRSDILNEPVSKINFSYFQEIMSHEIKQHNEAWVANEKCQVNIPMDNVVGGYKTPMNIEAPKLMSSWDYIDTIIFLMFGFSIFVLAMMPFFAAKPSETILKPR